jgi:hypothetical protein
MESKARAMIPISRKIDIPPPSEDSIADFYCKCNKNHLEILILEKFYIELNPCTERFCLSLIYTIKKEARNKS